jgi:hypothetical protein
MQETLIESYAEASVGLAELAGWLRDERELARSRLGQVTRALDVGDEIGKGTNVVAALIRALSVLSEAGATLHASFLLPSPVASFRAVLRPPLAEDPLLKHPLGLQSLETFLRDDTPSVARTSDMPDLDVVFQGFDPRFAAMVVVPVQGIDKLLGFAVLYYLPDRALPSPETLAHLGVLARIFRAPLELVAARGAL